MYFEALIIAILSYIEFKLMKLERMRHLHMNNREQQRLFIPHAVLSTKKLSKNVVFALSQPHTHIAYYLSVCVIKKMLKAATTKKKANTESIFVKCTSCAFMWCV